MNDDDFLQLAHEARELCIESAVPRIEFSELQRDPLLFLRDYVAPNRPVIITGALGGWRALELWTHSYLLARLGDTRVSVNATPNGFGDAVLRGAFVLPERRVMPFSHFIAQFERRARNAVAAHGGGGGGNDDNGDDDDGDDDDGDDDDGDDDDGDDDDDDDDEFGVKAAALAAFGRPARTQATAVPAIAGVELHSCAAAVECALCISAFPPDSIVTELPPSASSTSSSSSSSPSSLSTLCAAVNDNDLSTEADEILYLSEQNDCFRHEFSTALAADIQLELPWASAAFGCAPDAVNFWLGGDESVSAMHKDHYENMYAVVRGEKHFTLFAPVDAHFLEENVEFPVARFARDVASRQWCIVRDPTASRTPWIAADVECTADLRCRPRAARIAPLAVRARVCAGEILYLPAMWFHRVAQFRGKCESTVAVNFWHDMKFGQSFAYYNFARRASNRK